MVSSVNMSHEHLHGPLSLNGHKLRHGSQWQQQSLHDGLRLLLFSLTFAVPSLFTINAQTLLLLFFFHLSTTHLYIVVAPAVGGHMAGRAQGDLFYPSLLASRGHLGVYNKFLCHGEWEVSWMSSSLHPHP